MGRWPDDWTAEMIAVAEEITRDVDDAMLTALVFGTAAGEQLMEIRTLPETKDPAGA